MFKKEITKTKKIIITALLIAAFVILDRYLSINIQIIAINLSVIAIMLAGIILGPKYSVIVAVVGDLIGSLLLPFGPYFVGFTINVAISGLIFGIFLYKNPNKKNKFFVAKAIISNILVFLIVNVCLNALCLNILYKKAFIYYLGVRITAQLMVLPINIILILILNKTLMPIIEAHLYTEKKLTIEEYLNTFPKFRKKPNLNAMKYLTEKFDSPEKNLKCIHIAGTNGKGSVAEMLAKVLIEAGYKTGKFISPHLVIFNERIYINNDKIKTSEAEKILTDISKEVQNYNNIHKEKVTWFEVITLLALIYFKENKCDVVVIETGLGGKLDSTNVINSIISVLTNISYDHTNILGKTIEEITAHKVGIIKENSQTVAIKDEKTMEIIEKTCKEKNTNLHLVYEDNIKNYKFNENEQTFDYKNYKGIVINLKGKAQTINASEVLECVDILREKGFKISDENIRKALNSVVHKGRMEEISKKPLIIFEGGHNEDAIRNFKLNVRQYYSNYKEKIYIVSLLKTKDYKKILKVLLDNEEGTFIFTSGNNKKKYISKRALAKEAKKYIDKRHIISKELKEAIILAKKTNKEGITFILGSFYVYKDVIELLKKEKEAEND